MPIVTGYFRLGQSFARRMLREPYPAKRRASYVPAPPVGGYNVYAGPSAESIDYGEILSTVGAGVDTAAFALPDGVWFLAVTSQSVAGVESPGSIVLRAEIENGVLLDPRPNPIAPGSVVAIPGPGGKVHLEFAYHSAGELAEAAQVAVVRRAADGSLDWSSPIRTIPIEGATRFDADLTDVYDDGELVKLAIRAETAGGRGGRETICPPVVADATAPPAPSTLTAAQEEDPS